ncbi:hypothetical protein LAZ40_02305 [Cereibacter sphaeroides]|uniref:hypothetical protein n=1 Tax=Cereibacter sphaeroides TaxID=1063 RepID=UPI001F221AA0|nr:hypothetical protein [Cereibacter sphaeroides]MCE6957890.1 hypothetical protein [Cereibacter sphaeroides]MCE6971762.1 hypothetical protein [Cereibacter sphaeroides]
MRVLASSLTLATVLWSTTALAGTTPEGAAGLKTFFESWLGTAPGVVTVEEDGDAYRVTLDAAPLLKNLEAEGTVEVSPMELHLTDKGDGTWDFSYDQALSVEMAVPNAVEIDLEVKNIQGSGTFDPELAAVVASSSEFTGMDLYQKSFRPDGAIETEVTYHLDSGTSSSTATADGTGGVDADLTYAIQGVTETFTAPGFEATGLDKVTLTARDYSGEGRIEGLRSAALQGLVAFAVAHAGDPDSDPLEAELKALVSDSLPILRHASMSGEVNDLAVTTPKGPVSVAAAGVLVEFNGVTLDGLLREAFTINGLALPDGMVPDWAKSLVPSDLSLDLKLTRFDLDAPARLLLAATDPAMIDDAALLKAVLPEGSFDMTLAPGSVEAPAYRLGYEGQMSVTPGPFPPTGKARITLSGIDAIRTALEAAPEQDLRSALPTLGMAQAMSRPGENGELVWEIEAAPGGAVSVNGAPLGGQ